jgi:hypothetical protein
MSRKKYDAAVKVGEYTDQQGQTKARWLNVGAVIQTEHGHCLLLDRTFNPAGLPNPENRGNVMISLFPADRQQGQRQAPPPAGPDVGVDDTPF